MDPNEFRKKLKEKMKSNHEDFTSLYEKAIQRLKGLTDEEIEAITPDATGKEIYKQLITLVEEASKKNLSQAALKERINKLGDTAVRIAKKVPELVELFR
jgi:t-SNARE complex subunit (syntaxin)